MWRSVQSRKCKRWLHWELPNLLEQSLYSRFPLGCMPETYSTARRRVDILLPPNETFAAKPYGIKAIRQGRRRQKKSWRNFKAAIENSVSHLHYGSVGGRASDDEWLVCGMRRKKCFSCSSLDFVVERIDDAPKDGLPTIDKVVYLAATIGRLLISPWIGAPRLPVIDRSRRTTPPRLHHPAIKKTSKR
jgi:hypothetical protein